MACVLLTSNMKFKGVLTIQMQSDGPISLLVARCTHELDIKGLAEWREDSSDQSLLQAFGEGKLAITVQPDNNTDFYQSIVPLNGHSVTEAMEHYFLQSEQLSTRLWLVVQ